MTRFNLNRYDELKNKYKQLLKEHKAVLNKLAGYKAVAERYDKIEQECRQRIVDAKEAKMKYDCEFRELHIIKAKYQREMKELMKSIKQQNSVGRE